MKIEYLPPISLKVAAPKKVWDGIKAMGDKLSPFKQWTEEPDNKTNNPSDHNSDYSVSENKSDHSKSPNSDMSNSTTSSNPKQETKAEMYRTEQKSKIDAAFGERALGWAGKAKGMCDSCRSGR